jgi:hypothetical protein
MKLLGKFYRFNFSVFVLFLILLLSGCTPEGRLRWLDNKIGEIFKEFSREGKVEEESGDTSQLTAEDLSIELKEKIDVWLENNNYNRYGDPIDTMYTGGTPLFNEATGESLGRFSYILSKHPDILKKIGE